ncbi:MAG: FmdB family transcriptional regulator [Chrysiogenales bacterium]|nr:MAG: FmdB family transcriptional regulator [Chrysiogenales bacterium]
MPTYEYECLECKSRFELFQSINDEPVCTCVKCNGKVRKIFSSAGIIFKGSGFYVNDYKNEGAGKRKSDSGSDSSDSAKCPAAGSCSAACSANASSE